MYRDLPSDDRMLEVVGVVGVPQLGISYMIGELQHHRLDTFQLHFSFSSLWLVIFSRPIPFSAEGTKRH